MSICKTVFLRNPDLGSRLFGTIDPISCNGEVLSLLERSEISLPSSIRSADFLDNSMPRVKRFRIERIRSEQPIPHLGITIREQWQDMASFSMRESYHGYTVVITLPSEAHLFRGFKLIDDPFLVTHAPIGAEVSAEIDRLRQDLTTSRRNTSMLESQVNLLKAEQNSILSMCRTAMQLVAKGKGDRKSVV